MGQHPVAKMLGISSAALLGAVALGAAAWATLQSDVANHEVRIDSLEHYNTETRDRLTKIETTQTAQTGTLNEIKGDVKKLLEKP